VGMSLFFLPAGIFIGALAVMFFPALWSAILIKSADGSLKQSVNKSAIELLALPIPIETKNQAKTFIDVFVDSFATGMSGLILITLVIAFKLPVEIISLVIIALTLLWFFYAARVRLEYIKLFKLKLKLNKEHLKESLEMPDLNKESVYGGLAKVLENGTESQILFALRNMDDIQHEMLFIPIRKLLHHKSDEVLKEAISRLYFYRSKNLSEEILPFTHHKSLAVKVSAIEYLIEHAAYERKNVINRFLLEKDYHIKYATLLAIANETRDNPELKLMFRLSAIIRASIEEIDANGDAEELLFKKKSVLKAIGSANLDEYYPYILEALNSQEAEVTRAAIQSAGISLDESFIPVLYQFLLRKEFNTDASAALANYGFKIIAFLKEEVFDKKANADFARSVPSVVERIGTQAGVDFLFELLDFDDIIVRSESVRALTVIKGQSPFLVFNKKQIINNIFDEAKLFQNILTALYVQQNRIEKPASGKTGGDIVFETRLSLIKLLEKRLDDNLDRIFKFLGLKYPQDEIDIAYQGLKSEKSELRISAIEFLDNLLEINLKRILIPILETSVEESVTKDGISELKIRDIGQAECYSMLLEGRDITVKLAVLNLISVLNDVKYLPIVKMYVNHQNNKIANAASRTMAVLQKK
jgi:AAA family ATP:ADP antiporter